MRYAVVLLLAAVAGCARGAPGKSQSPSEVSNAAGRPDTAGPPRSTTAASQERSAELVIRLNWDEADPRAAAFEIVGLSERDLEHLAAPSFDETRWPTVFAVFVAPGGPTQEQHLPILGSYQVGDGGVRFVPQFPLEAGLSYRAVFDASLIAGRPGPDSAGVTASGTRRVVAPFTIPHKNSGGAATELTHVFPSSDTLPENQLKFYLHFSAAMSRGEAYRHIHLIAESGREVELPFLELDEELWDPNGQRFTLFFDPGRIKRGLKPREEVGPALEEGKRYTLVIDREWLDARGLPLRETVRKSFRVGAPDETQPDHRQWEITSPPPDSVDPLVIRFPEPLDHAMLFRVLVVVDRAGHAVAGKVAVDSAETRWELTPEESWQPGDYAVVVETSLEDLAGNSIARLFDVDQLRPIQLQAARDTVSLTFCVGQ
jgi:hypothetical protein